MIHDIGLKPQSDTGAHSSSNPNQLLLGSPQYWLAAAGYLPSLQYITIHNGCVPSIATGVSSSTSTTCSGVAVKLFVAITVPGASVPPRHTEAVTLEP